MERWALKETNGPGELDRAVTRGAAPALRPAGPTSARASWRASKPAVPRAPRPAARAEQTFGGRRVAGGLRPGRGRGGGAPRAPRRTRPGVTAVGGRRRDPGAGGGPADQAHAVGPLRGHVRGVPAAGRSALRGRAPRSSRPPTWPRCTTRCGACAASAVSCGAGDDLAATLASSHGGRRAPHPRGPTACSTGRTPPASGPPPRCSRAFRRTARRSSSPSVRRPTTAACAPSSPPGRDLYVFTWQVGDLVLTEVTPPQRPAAPDPVRGRSLRRGGARPQACSNDRVAFDDDDRLAGDGGPFAAQLALELTPAPRDLAGPQAGASEALRPVWRRNAVRRARHRVLEDAPPQARRNGTTKSTSSPGAVAMKPTRSCRRSPSADGSSARTSASVP